MILEILIFSGMIVAGHGAPSLVSRVDNLSSNRIEREPTESPDIASQVFDFLRNLSDAEKIALVPIYVNQLEGIYKTDEEVVGLLKQKTPVLFDRFMKVVMETAKSYEDLGEEAKAFLSGLMDEIRWYQASVRIGKRMTEEEFKRMFNDDVDKYNALTAEAKEDMDKHFPATFSFIKNKKIQAMIMKVIADKFGSFAEFLTDLKDAAPGLHERIMKLSAEMMESYNEVGDEAKAFLSEIAVELNKEQVVSSTDRQVMAEASMAKLTAYRALSAGVKAELDRHFPVTMALVKNDRVLAIVRRTLEGKL